MPKQTVSIFNMRYENKKYVIDIAFSNKKVSYEFTSSTLGLTLKDAISHLSIEKGGSYPESLSPCQAEFTYSTGTGGKIIPIKLEISAATAAKFKAAGTIKGDININNTSTKNRKRTFVYDIMPSNLTGLIWARGPIHKVKDGDTFSILVKESNGIPVGQDVVVRLVGIDTTELAHLEDPDLHADSAEKNKKWLIAHGMKTDSANLKKNLELTYKHAAEAGQMIREEFSSGDEQYDDKSRWALAIADDYSGTKDSKGKDMYGRYLCNVFFPLESEGYNAISINKSMLATESTVIPGTALASPYTFISKNGAVESRFPINTWWQFSLDYKKNKAKIDKVKSQPVKSAKEEFLEEHGLTIDKDGTILYYGSSATSVTETIKHVFKSTDTWESIAAQYTKGEQYTSVAEIYKANGLTGSFAAAGADKKSWINKTINVPVYKKFSNTYNDYISSRYISNLNDIPADCEDDDYVTLIHDDRDTLDGIVRTTPEQIDSLYDSGFLRIGDCTFSIPPISIKIENYGGGRQVETLRSKSSIQTQYGHTARIITISLFFSDAGQINGYPYEMPELGETYYRNGLRPLIAQFKKAPFLPIENAVINDTHKIYSVALRGLQLKSVPGYPSCIEASLSLFEFNHLSYMPQEEYFAGTFNWKLFRWYYQRPLQESNKYIGRTYLEKIDTLDDTLEFYIPDETVLAQRQQAIKDLQYKVGAEAFVSANSSTSQESGKMIQDTAEFKAAKAEYSKFKAWCNKYSMANTYGRFYNSRGVFDPTELLLIPDENKQERLNYKNALVELLDSLCGFKSKCSKAASPSSRGNTAAPTKANRLHFLPNYIDSIVLFLRKNGYSGLAFSGFQFSRVYNATGALDGRGCRRFSDAGGSYVLDLQSTRNKMSIKDVVGNMAIVPIDDIIKCKTIELGESEAKNSFENYKNEIDELNYQAHMSEQDVPTVRFPVNDFVVLSIGANMENNLVGMQIQSDDGPVYQYLGAKDGVVGMELKVLSRNGLRQLYDLMSTTQRLARDYRIAITSGVLTIKNNYISLLGAKDYLINDIVVQTSDTDKETFDVTLNLVAFDKTQRLREDLDYTSIGETMNTDIESFKKFSKTKTTDSEGFEYGNVDVKLRDLEVYPDLELPTYKELNNALPFLNIIKNDGTKLEHMANPGGAKFVDPDFYIRTSESFKEYVTELLGDGAPAIVMKDEYGFEATELGPQASATTMEKPNVNLSDDTKVWLNDNLGEVDYGTLQKNTATSEYRGPLGTYNGIESKIIQDTPEMKKGGPLETLVDTVQDFFGKKPSSTARVNISDREELNKYASCAKNAHVLATGDFKYAKGVGKGIVNQEDLIYSTPTEAEMQAWYGRVVPLTTAMSDPTPNEFVGLLNFLVKKYFGNHPSDLSQIKNGLDCATYKYGRSFISAPEITREKITNVLKSIYDCESGWKQFKTLGGKRQLKTNIVRDSKYPAFAVGIAQINIIDTGVNSISEARRAAWDWKYCLELGVRNFALHFNICVKSDGNERLNPLDYAIIRYKNPSKGNAARVPRPIEDKYYAGIYERFSRTGAFAQGKGSGYGADRTFWEATPDAVFDGSLMSQEQSRKYMRNLMSLIVRVKADTAGSYTNGTKEMDNILKELNNSLYKNAKVLTINVNMEVFNKIKIKNPEYAFSDALAAPSDDIPNPDASFSGNPALLPSINIGVFDTHDEFAKAAADKSLYRMTSGMGDPLQAALATHMAMKFKDSTSTSYFDYTSKIVVIKEGAYKAYKSKGKFADLKWNQIYELVDIDSIEGHQVAVEIREQEIESYLYHKKENIANVYRTAFRDILDYDQRGRLVMAFPTYQMFIIDEGRWLAWHKLWDNFYGYNSIASIDVYKDRRVVADTAVIKMTNVYGNLTTHDTEVQYGEWEWRFSDLFFGSESEKQHVWNQFWGIPSAEILRARKERLDSLVLKAGARISLRLGYGSNAFFLPTVFNGTITEMDTQEIMTVVAQGDGIELTNKLNVQPDATTDPGLLGGTKEPREMICELLTSKGGFFRNLASKYIGGEFFSSHPLGIVHFGNQIIPDAILKTADPFDINEDYGEAGMNIYCGAGVNTFSQWIYTEGVKKGETIGMEWGSTPLPRFKGDEPNIKIYLFDKTPWDICQTYSACCPDYISAVMPFEYRSTLFFGKPWWGVVDRYEYKYKWDDSLNAVTREPVGTYRKSFSQFRMYQSDLDIINNSIKATDEYMYTNVIGVYNEGDGAKKTMPIQADSDIYPDKQTTALVHIPIQASGWLSNLWTQDKYALAAATSALKDYMKEMYQGELVVLGDPSVKPYDMIYISDSYSDMYGNAEVKKVVHQFSKETGLITSITPDCVTVIDDMQGTSLHTWCTSLATSVIAYRLGKKIANSAWKALLKSPIADSLRKYGANGVKWVLKDILAGSIKSEMSKEATEKVADKLADWILSKGLDANELAKRGIKSADLSAEDFKILKSVIGESDMKTFKITDQVLNDIWKGVKPFKEMYDNPKTIGKVIDETWEKTGWLNNKHLFGDIQDIHKFKINGVEKELTGNLDDLMAQLKKGKDKFEYIGKVGTKKPGLFAKLGNRTVGITQDVAKVTSKVGLRTTAGTIRTAATLGKVVGSATLIGLVAELGITFLTSSVVEKYGRFLRSRQAVTIIPLTYRSKPFVAGINGHQGMVYGDSPGALDSFFAGTGWGGGVISGLYWLFGIEAPDYSGETGTDELSEQRG